MEPAYFEARFLVEELLPKWPDEFAIITAYATTGETWTREENEAADRRLHEALARRSPFLVRITGYSPTTGHGEPGWAAVLPFDEACDVGLQFRQDAIFWVSGDDLSVTYCDERRALVPAGSFRERLDISRAACSGDALSDQSHQPDTPDKPS
jgi:hypothetical protein